MPSAALRAAPLRTRASQEKEPRSPALPGSTPALPLLPRVEHIPSPARPSVPGKTRVFPSEGPWHV